MALMEAGMPRKRRQWEFVGRKFMLAVSLHFRLSGHLDNIPARNSYNFPSNIKQDCQS